MNRYVVVFLSTLVILLSSARGHAFVRESGQGGVLAFWPNATTSLNLEVGCPNTPLSQWGPCWTDAVMDAANQWPHPDTAFRFTIQSPTTATADPCGDADNTHTIAFRLTTCGNRGFGSSLAVTYFLLNPATGAFVDADTVFAAGQPWTTYSGPLQTNAAGTTVYDFHRVAIHELGHVLGLDHPDDFGQHVAAIMNRTVSDIDTPQADDRAGAHAIYPAAGATAPVTGVLENPQSNSAVSGISTVSGWVCSASQVTLQIDATASLAVPYGSLRGDTQAACGAVNTGFGLLVNWNNLTPGPHQVVVSADGVEVGRAAVTVASFGTDFLRGASGTVVVPFNGRSVTLQWQESLQNFVISDVQ